MENNAFAFYCHHPCLDGFLCSWVAWKAGAPKSKIFRFHSPEDVSEPPEQPGTVYFLGCCPNIHQYVYFFFKGHRVVVFDSELNSIDYLPTEERKEVDSNEHSFIMAWKHFMPEKPVPFLLNFVNKLNYGPFDGKFGFTDFQWGLLKLKIEEVEEIDAIIEKGEAGVKEIIEVGAQHRKAMDAIQLNSRKMTLHGVRVGYLKLEPSMDVNGIAMRMLKEKDVDMAIPYREIPTNPVMYRLFFRSMTPEVDCEEFAKKHFNGGGWTEAACAEVGTLPFTPV